MNIFECEVCGNTDPQNHEELVNHIVTIHIDYTDSEAESYSNLWEEHKLEEQEAEKWYGDDIKDNYPDEH
jgi:hypothetical protein